MMETIAYQNPTTQFIRLGEGIPILGINDVQECDVTQILRNLFKSNLQSLHETRDILITSNQKTQSKTTISNNINTNLAYVANISEHYFEYIINVLSANHPAWSKELIESLNKYISRFAVDDLHNSPDYFLQFMFTHPIFYIIHVYYQKRDLIPVVESLQSLKLICSYHLKLLQLITESKIPPDQYDKDFIISLAKSI